MKKILARSLSAALASLMLFSVGCTEGDSTSTDAATDNGSTAPTVSELKLTQTQHTEEFETVSETYSFGFDNIDKGIFAQPQNVKMGRGNSNSAKFLDDTVSSLRIIKSFGETSTSTYEGKLQCKMEGVGWDAMYIGIRNDGYDATVNEGVWFIVKEENIGLRVGGWDGGRGHKYVPSPVSFADYREFRIVDDPVKNEITFYADDDNGNEIVLLRAVITGEGTDNTVEIYEGDKTTPSIVNKCEVPRSGQAIFWCHFAEKDVVNLRDLKVSGSYEVYKGGTSADPLFTKDVFSDTWVATDDEGRVITTSSNAANGKDVGMFYFVWHQGVNRTLYDHSKSYYEGGVAALEKVIKQGTLGYNHYWAEPYFGYYSSNDEWVIRKHIYMLNDAGVDFLFFDFTNGIIYEDTLLLVLDTMAQMRVEGYDTPKVVFHCGDSFVGAKNAALTIPQLWALLYSVDRYKDLWYIFDGKPLIFAENDIVESEEINSFFTFRRSWADSSQSWYNSTRGKGCWAWGDVFQQPGLSPEGEVEQMVVMSGFWANGTCGALAGRSFSDGKQPEATEYSFSLTNDGTSGKGIAYQEHFDNAIETNPDVVMIVGWNEWVAGRWESNALTNYNGMNVAGAYKVDSSDPLKKNYYVDAFSPEFSRDIEPVNGIYKDNYYYQTVLNTRAYKGTRGFAGAFGQKTIDLAAGAEQWLSVGPEYRDYQGDVTHRDFYAATSDAQYTNTSGRNDFVTAKVSVDGDNVYFYAECANDITSPEGTNWMNLFIDSDCNASTGWYGYDYIINRSQNGGKASVEAFATTEKNAEWSVSSAGEAEYTVSGNTIVIKLPKSVVALGDTFDFKWADNSVADGKEIMQFLDLGDAAPNGRFNYRYTTTDATIAAPSCLTSDMVVLKSNSYNAYAGGKQVMLDAASTKIVALGEKGTVYLPLSFVTANLGIAEGTFTEQYTYAGTTYVAINSAIEAAGKKITVSDNGLIVIASAEVTDIDTLETLYRSLM